VYPAQIFFGDYEDSFSDGSASSEKDNFKMKSLGEFQRNLKKLVSVNVLFSFPNTLVYLVNNKCVPMTNSLEPAANASEANRR
jgi:hypothetical protein